MAESTGKLAAAAVNVPAATSSATAPPDEAVNAASNMSSVMQVETLLQELGFGEVYNESTFAAANFTTVHRMLLFLLIRLIENVLMKTYCTARMHSVQG